MSAKTDLADVTNQIQKFWAPIFMKELRASLLLGSLVNKDYQGQIYKGGDTVRVSQINAPNGALLSVGTDADSFSTDILSTSYVDIKADKRAVAAYEFDDLVDLQSQIDKGNPEVLEALKYAMGKQINTYLYSLVAPSASSPQLSFTGVSDFDAAELSSCRKLAAQQLWLKTPGWYGMFDPSYYSDLLNAMTLTNNQYVGGDAPVVGGQVGTQRFGFNIYEDNSLPNQNAVLFHPDFLHLVMQSEVQIKVSDMHGWKKFGYVMSVDVVFGAVQGIAGNLKCIKVINT